MARKKSRANNKYKDTVFRMLFGSDPVELLGLYNAVNGTDYTEVADLTINTLDGAIYAKVKNDVSFLFQDMLSLYEHQSTENPNLPLRDLFYVADLLQEMNADVNLYSSGKKKIPAPHFVVFYNGVRELDGKSEYCLSELYEVPEKEPQLELIVKIININHGQENSTMQGCKTLREYAAFVDMVRKYQKKMTFEKALPKAVDECINRNILKNFLKKHKAQVIKMSIYEFDEEQYKKWFREEGELLKIIKQVIKKYTRGKSPSEIAEDLEDEESTIRPIYDMVAECGAEASPETILHRMQSTAV